MRYVNTLLLIPNQRKQCTDIGWIVLSSRYLSPEARSLPGCREGVWAGGEALGDAEGGVVRADAAQLLP
jgi:hypothetical protein